MPNHNRNQPSEMEKNAATIGCELKKLKKKCFVETEKKTISMTEVVYIMEYMADQLAEHPYLFLGHFMGHLNILSQIVQLHVSRKDFTAICTKFTSILCKVIPIKNLPTQFLYDLLEKWLQCLEQIPCDSKCCVYQTIECDLRRNCCRFLVDAPCYSMQMQMLDVICSYLYDEQTNVNDWKTKSYEFLKSFKGVVDDFKDDGLVNAVASVFAAKNASLAVTGKHRLLSALNGFAENPAIYSIPIKALKSKICGETEQKFKSGWMHFNTAFGTVEFSVTEYGKRRTMCIKPRKLHNIEMIDSTDTSSLKVKFLLVSKPRQQSGQSKPSKLSKTIKITMATGCVKSELITLLHQVFPAMDFGRFQNDENNNSDVNSKTSSSSPVSSSQPEQMSNDPKTAAIDANLRRVSVVSKDSTYYGDGSGLFRPANKTVDQELNQELELPRVEPCDIKSVQNNLPPSPPRKPSAAVKSKNKTEDLQLDLELDLSYGKPIDSKPCDVKRVENDLPSSPPRKRPAAAKSKNKVEKSIDVEQLSIYDFDADDDDEPEPLPKKSRGRGRRPAQPKKRAKPAPFPRVKSPSVERQEKKFTIRAKTPVGPSAKVSSSSTATNANTKKNDRLTNKLPNVKSEQMPAKKRATHSYLTSSLTAISSGMDKLGSAFKTRFGTDGKKSLKKTSQVPNEKRTVVVNGSLSSHQKIDDGKTTEIDMDDIIDMGVDMGLDDFDANGANKVHCRCRDEKLRSKLVQIRESADHAVRIMDKCCCSVITAVN